MVKSVAKRAGNTSQVVPGSASAAESRSRAKVTALNLFLIPLFVILQLAWTPGFAEERVALVIGNGTYEHVPGLSNPENDASAIAQLLKDGGFSTVIHRNNVSRLELEDAVDRFSKLVETASVAVFYYAGHGIQVDGENYIIPIDASIEGRRDIRKLTTISEILHEVGLAADLGVVILDACRDNPFDEAITRSIGAGLSSRGLSPPGKVSGNTLVAYATEADGVASDGVAGEANSPYTTALLQHLSTPGEDIRKVFGRVRDDVISSTRASQRPFVYGSLGGADYPLFPATGNTQSTTETTSAKPAISSDALELALWQSAVEGNTRAEYQAYLQSFPEGIFVVSAQDRIAKIEQLASSGIQPEKVPTQVAPRQLPPGKARLTINVNPADATITLVNIAAPYDAGMVLDSGQKYDIQIQKQGYRKFRRFIKLKENEHILNVDLKPDGSAALAANGRSAPQINRRDGEIFVNSRGVASASGAAGNERGQLRLQAIGNALELAVMQVSGVLLNTESAITDKSSASTISDSQDTIERLRQDSLFHNTVVSRTKGHARLVNVQEEDITDDIYTVVAEVAVSEKKLKTALQDAGVLWQQVGRPSIRITTKGAGPYLLEYLRNAFSQNGIDVTTNTQDETAFRLDVTRNASSNKTEFGTYAAHCSLAYELKNVSVQTAVAANRHTSGPEPGFSAAEAVANCDKKITRHVTKKMVTSLLKALNSIARDGREYNIELRQLDGALVTRITTLINNIFRVSSVSNVRYRGGDLSMQVLFKGPPLEFAELLALTISYDNLNVKLNSIVESKLVFDASG